MDAAIVQAAQEGVEGLEEGAAFDLGVQGVDVQGVLAHQVPHLAVH